MEGTGLEVEGQGTGMEVEGQGPGMEVEGQGTGLKVEGQGTGLEVEDTCEAGNGSSNFPGRAAAQHGSLTGNSASSSELL